MDWNAIGAVGEILGALAVLVSVFYLATQIRQNTKSIKASAERELGSNSNAAGMALSATQIPILVVKASKDISQLTEEEIAQFGWWLNATLRHWETAFYQFQEGYISEDSWEGLFQQIRMFMQSDGVQRYWAARKNTYRSDFRELIDGIDFSDAPAVASDKLMESMLSKRMEDEV